MITPYVFSPTPDELTFVGKLIKRIGKRGEVLASFSVQFKVFPKAFLIFQQNECFPIIVETVTPRNEDFIIKFERISYEQAVEYSNCNLYVLPDVSIKNNKDAVKNTIIGFTLINEGGEVMGIVTDIIENLHQDIICFNHQEQEVMFPWVDNFVLKIHHRKKEIIVDLPEGIIQLNYKK